MTLNRITVCPACKSEKVRAKVAPRNADGLTECSSCRTQFVRVQPSDQRLNEIYGPDYYRSWECESVEKVIEIKNETYRRVIRRAKIDVGEKLLEIGCAQGHGIRVTRSLGCEYFGVDLNREAIDFAKRQYEDGVFVHGVVHKELFGSIKFDRILMIDFIEHVRYPEQEVAVMASVLNRNGSVILSTPRSKSITHLLTGKYWPQYREEHLTYFSKAGIVKLLESNGFTVEVVKPTLKVMSPNYFYGQSIQYSPLLVRGLAYVFKSVANLLRIQQILLPFGEMTVIATLVGSNNEHE